MSVLPVLAKVFEAEVHTQLYAYLETNSLLHPAQSGFRPLHNTQHVLLKTVDDWRTALDKDLPNSVERCTVNLYADDTTIYFASKAPQEVKEALETDLCALAVWIKQNQLKINVNKTQLMVLSRRRRKSEAEQIIVQHDGTVLRSEEKVRYLGVEVDRNLTWRDHVNTVRQNCLSNLAKLPGPVLFSPLEPGRCYTILWYFPIWITVVLFGWSVG